MRARRLAVILVLLTWACTQPRGGVPTTVQSAGSAGATPLLDSPAPTASGSQTVSPNPVPPVLKLVAPTVRDDFTRLLLTVTFSVSTEANQPIKGAEIYYDGVLVKSFEGPGPVYSWDEWNPNQINASGKPADAQSVGPGTHTLRLVALSVSGLQGSLEWTFNKPLRLGAWEPMAAAPVVLSHTHVYPDSASPPTIFSLWGSVDGIDTTVQPRRQNYAFNPAGQGAWTEARFTGTSVPRALYTSCAHPSGQLVYVIGGRTGATDLRTVDVVAPLRRVAEASLVPLLVARREASVVYMQNALYIMGGVSGSLGLYDVERISLGRDGYPIGDAKRMASLVNARYGANAHVFGGRIYVFGGGYRPIEVYDPATDAWRFLTQTDGTTVATPEAWRNSLMIPVGDRLYFFGGEKEDGQPVDRIFEFNPGTNIWRDWGPLPRAQDQPSGQTRLAGCFLGDTFYLIGGQSLPERRLSAQVFKSTVF